MSKSAKKSKSPSTASVPAPSQTTAERTVQKPDAGSKQSQVIALLQAPAGATIAALMKATGWQQHSVRGFLAGVVRKKLKLKLNSTKIDGHRVYRINQGSELKASSGKQAKRRAA